MKFVSHIARNFVYIKGKFDLLGAYAFADIHVRAGAYANK